jgi:hypothetical protein
MGAGASVPASFDVLTSEQIAELVASLGNAYLGYKEIFISNGISGDIISGLKTVDEMKSLLQDMGITNALHQRVIVSKLEKAEHIGPAASTAGPSATGAPSTAAGERPKVDLKEVISKEGITMTPRSIMSRLFEIQGIATDPTDLDTVITKLSKTLKKGFGDGINTYDCFINYRVAADSDLAEKLYLYLNLAGYRPFLDKKCLKNGENWKEGFLSGAWILLYSLILDFI